MFLDWDENLYAQSDNNSNLKIHTSQSPSGLIDWDKLAGKNGHVIVESVYKVFKGNLKCTKGGAEGTPGQCQCLDDLGDETCCQVLVLPIIKCAATKQNK